MKSILRFDKEILEKLGFNGLFQILLKIIFLLKSDDIYGAKVKNLVFWSFFVTFLCITSNFGLDIFGMSIVAEMSAAQLTGCKLSPIDDL